MSHALHIPGGYVLSSRIVLESRLWQYGPEVFRLAHYILLCVRHDEKPQKMPGFDLKRGEMVTSLAALAEGCQWFENRKVRTWSRQKVRRMLADLVEIEFVEVISDTYGTHLKVCKYDAYQDARNYNSNSHGTTSKQRRNNVETTSDTYNKEKNDKNGNNTPPGAHGDLFDQPEQPEKPPQKKPYGEFGRVRLTDAEYANVIERQGEGRAKAGIEHLDNYIEAHGKRYKSHYAVLKPTGWVWESVAKANGQQPGTDRKLAAGQVHTENTPPPF